MKNDVTDYFVKDEEVFELSNLIQELTQIFCAYFTEEGDETRSKLTENENDHSMLKRKFIEYLEINNFPVYDYQHPIMQRCRESNIQSFEEMKHWVDSERKKLKDHIIKDGECNLSECRITPVSVYAANGMISLIDQHLDTVSAIRIPKVSKK